MVDETSKTRLVRGKDFSEKYLLGKVLDIGAGEDRVCAHAEGFDTKEGDAASHLCEVCCTSGDTLRLNKV